MDFKAIRDFLSLNDLTQITILFKKSVSFLFVEELNTFKDYDKVKIEFEKIYHYLIPRMKPELKYGVGFKKEDMLVSFERKGRDEENMVYALKFLLPSDISGNNFKAPEQKENGDNSETHIRMELGNTTETNL